MVIQAIAVVEDEHRPHSDPRQVVREAVVRRKIIAARRSLDPPPFKVGPDHAVPGLGEPLHLSGCGVGEVSGYAQTRGNDR